MSSEFDAMTAEYLQLFRLTGLEHAEVIRQLPREKLVYRLVAASEELAITPKEPKVLVEGIRIAAEKKGAGKLSDTDLRDRWWDIVSRPTAYDLPGTDDFPVWGRDPTDAADLPGDDDFPVWEPEPTRIAELSGSDDSQVWERKRDEEKSEV